VQDGVLAGLIAGGLGGEQVQRRSGPGTGGHNRQGWEQVEQAAGHVAVQFVGAAQQGRRPGRPSP